jgi:hypothetical protein
LLQGIGQDIMVRNAGIVNAVLRSAAAGNEIVGPALSPT